VTIQRRLKHRWVWAADDLGMQILWSSDANGHYIARWEVPLSAARGNYRFVVTAKRYRVASKLFVVAIGAILAPRVAGNAVELLYPQPFLLNDWTYRPLAASGGAITFSADGRRVVARTRAGADFRIPAGASVTIPARGAHDRYGNTNPRAIKVR
jgi:hypothetical protein